MKPNIKKGLLMSIKRVGIRDIDLTNTHFHFTSRTNLDTIAKEGLKARAGDASMMVGDTDPRVYLSKGRAGLLKIKDTFIQEFKTRRICDIPQEYREYFDVSDYSSTEQVKPEDVYSAMEKRFKNEVYLVVDAVKGEDYLPEDVKSLWGIEHDIQGKPNHDIDVEKLSLLTTEKGENAFDVIEYSYNSILEANPGRENIVKNMFPDLSEMLEFIKQRDIMISQKSTQELGKEVLPELKDTSLLDKIEAMQEFTRKTEEQIK